MHKDHVTLPGSKIGILGGGQLGKMLAHAAQVMGYEVIIYTPNRLDPALAVVRKSYVADWHNYSQLNKFIDEVDVVTYEFENIPINILRYVSRLNFVNPSASILGICQDRLLEKEFFLEKEQLGVPFTAISAVDDIEKLLKKDWNGDSILKTRSGGYDGKGQIICWGKNELGVAWDKLGQVPCILEERINFSCEASVVGARNARGEIETFPAVKNIHQDGVLRETFWPSKNITPAAAVKMTEIFHLFAEQLNLIGVMTIEFFITLDGRVLINEMAPRVHNSGHGSIEAAYTSQFEQHIRAICNLPLGNSSFHTPFSMKNILGGKPEDYLHYLNNPNAHLHWYGKPVRYEQKAGEQVRKITKEGYITILQK